MSPEDYEIQIGIYETRVRQLNANIEESRFIERINADQKFLDDSLHRIHHKGKNTDFLLISIIRWFYTSANADDHEAALRMKFLKAINKYPFWPSGNDISDGREMDGIIFWSENHILMTLGCAYLFKQWINNSANATGDTAKDKNWEQCLESRLLIAYLEAHCSRRFGMGGGEFEGNKDNKAGGLYEVNSHVYIPYTLAALLNLYDFAESEHVKHLASKLINIVGAYYHWFIYHG